jgi:hypothetical protein
VLAITRRPAAARPRTVPPMGSAPPSGARRQSPGWQASLELGLSPWHGRTALTYRRQRGPLSVQRPFYPEGDVCHLYLLHPPGGVVGGDGLEIQVNLEADARALVTTPGATKFYRSAGDRAHQFTTLRLGAACHPGMVAPGKHPLHGGPGLAEDPGRINPKLSLPGLGVPMPGPARPGRGL